MSYSGVESIEKHNIILDYLKGLIVAMMISFGLVLAFAFSLKWIDLNDSSDDMLQVDNGEYRATFHFEAHGNFPSS